MKLKCPQFVAAFTATGFAFSAGTTLAWTNPIELPTLNGTLGFDVNAAQFAWLGPYLSLGALLACIPTGYLVDAIGRRKVLTLMVIPFLLGWLFIAVAVKVWMLYVGRFLLGLVFGMVSIVVPLYVGEIAEKEIRGLLGSLMEFQILFGIIFVFVLGAFVAPLILTIACSIFPLIVGGVAICFVPESPNFLLTKGNHVEAAKSIKWLHRQDFYVEEQELKELKTQDVFAEARPQTEPKLFVEVLKSRAGIKALFVNMGLIMFQQMSGINPITFYSTSVFDAGANGSDGSALDPRYSTIILGAVRLIATLFATSFVDKLGRRVLLLLSAALMGFSLLSLGFYFHFFQQNSELVSNMYWFPIFTLCGFGVAFQIGFGPVPWIMLGELFPAGIKGPASSVCITIMWVSSFLADKLGIAAKNWIGFSLTFWIFTAFSFLGFIFVMFCVPETKGKSLDEIQAMLLKKKNNKCLA